jgi:hypothetical protein
MVETQVINSKMVGINKCGFSSSLVDRTESIMDRIMALILAKKPDF